MRDETDFQQLADYLRQWNGRRLLRDGLVWLPRAVLAGLMAAVVVAIVAWQRPLLDARQLAYIAIGFALVGLLVGLVGLLGRRHSLAEQARFADRQFGLRERAVTAVEIQTHALPAPPDIAAAQLHDALTAASLVNPARQLPLQLIRRDWLFLLASILLLILAVRLPNPQETVLQQTRAIQESIEQQIEALTALQEEIRQNEALTAEQQEELLEPIQDALQALQSGGLSQEGAVATLSEAEADLRQLAADTSADDLRRRLQEAGQPLANNSASSSLGQSLQNGDLFAAANAAAQLADDLPSLNQSEREALAEALAETAESLRDVDSQLADQLAAAAEALQNGDVAAAQEALRQASGTLQQRAQEAAASQQAQAAAGQLAESRQEVAQAGQPGQSGQPGQAAQQGGQPGQGQGEGQGQGQGQGDGPQALGQSEGGQPGGFGGTSAGGGSAESVFVPPFRDLSGEAGIDIELPAECRANPAACGALLSELPTEFRPVGSTVPYAQVFGDYRNAASEALAGDYIPLGMKGFIRDYFSSLEP